MKDRLVVVCIVFALVSFMIPIANAYEINAPKPPSADFTGFPQSGVVPLTVTFNGTSDGTGPLTWAWDFGDGSVENATVQSPVHTYADIGIYDVSLTVCKSTCSVTTKPAYITVTPAPVVPVADFTGFPQLGAVPLTVTFYDNSTGTDPLIWAWDFGDGSAENATVQSPVHTYANVGIYNVSLIVSNIAGSNTTIKTNYITVSEPPVADFTGSPQSGAAPLTVMFMDNSTGTGPLTYAWDFGDASPENATVQNPIHTFANAGTYNISLMVSNAVGSNMTIKTNYINVSAAPVADFTGSPLSGIVPLTVTFIDNSTGTGPLTYGWDFGDASPENATVQNPIHTYAAVGTYNVSLTVTNAVGSNMTTRFSYITVTHSQDRIGVVRNNNTWLLDTSGDGAYGTGDFTYTFGKAGDVYVTGNWNADRKTEIGVVRNGNTWVLDSSGNGAYDTGDLVYTFGKTGDAYVTGDWNQDGKTEIGVVRNGNTWLLDVSGDGAYGAGDLAYAFGKAGDVYVTGDWNNDNKDEIGVVRNNNTWLLDAFGNGVYGTGDFTYIFGKAGDVYVTGDWNTDGKTEIGVVRNGNTWLLDASGNGAYGTGDFSYAFGKTGDVYVTGRWN